MALLTTLGLIASGASAINSFIQGRAISRQAEKGLEDFNYQPLVNLAAGLSPSFEAERQLRAQTSEMLATASDVAQGRDVAGALGLLQMGYKEAQKSQLQGLTSMLEKDYQADLEMVKEEQAIRGIQEQRDIEKLNSLRAQAMAGKQMETKALTDVAMTAVSAGLAQESIKATAGIDPNAKNLKDVVDTVQDVKTVADVVDTTTKLSAPGQLKLDAFNQGLQETFDSGSPSSPMSRVQFQFGTMPELGGVYAPEFAPHPELSYIKASDPNLLYTPLEPAPSTFSNFLRMRQRL